MTDNSPSDWTMTHAVRRTCVLRTPSYAAAYAKRDDFQVSFWLGLLKILRLATAAA
jgi:hypothetical protein